VEDARYFEDGKLVVFKRAQRYYARIHLAPRKYISRSLKTADEKQAEKSARKLFYTFEQKVE